MWIECCKTLIILTAELGSVSLDASTLPGENCCNRFHIYCLVSFFRQEMLRDHKSNPGQTGQFFHLWPILRNIMVRNAVNMQVGKPDRYNILIVICLVRGYYNIVQYFILKNALLNIVCRKQVVRTSCYHSLDQFINWNIVIRREILTNQGNGEQVLKTRYSSKEHPR